MRLKARPGLYSLNFVTPNRNLNGGPALPFIQLERATSFEMFERKINDPRDPGDPPRGIWTKTILFFQRDNGDVVIRGVWVFSFHPMFVTKVDRAFAVHCIFKQKELTVTSRFSIKYRTTLSKILDSSVGTTVTTKRFKF